MSRATSQVMTRSKLEATDHIFWSPYTPVKMQHPQKGQQKLYSMQWSFENCQTGTARQHFVWPRS